MILIPDFRFFLNEFFKAVSSFFLDCTMCLAMVGAFLPLLTASARADESDTFFDDSFVHEIRITFENEDWYSTLYDSHSSDVEDPYFPASFTGDGVSMGTIGVRFKGNSSFRINSEKKSLKLDFDEYDEANDELTFFGLKKLNLNNSYKDPSFLREKLFLDFASQFVPTIRSVHTKVYVNDVYLGLYLAVEQVDKTFIESRFGSSEDGNLYKGAVSDELDNGAQSDFGSDLVWEGSSESAYHDHYQLKTNETENDYSGLVSFIDVLNNGDPAAFPDELESLLNVENALASIALNSLFMNLDSYTGSAHNYYIYQSDETGQFHHIFWDANEAFGSFLQYWSGSDPLQTDPFWHPTSEARPLMEQLWENEDYERLYLKLMAKMLREGFDSETIMSRANVLADIIRADVYADNYKQYSNAAFESNLTSNYGNVYGLEPFITGRVSYLQGVLNTYATQQDIRINEIASGETAPWVELYNAGVGAVDVSGIYLTDTQDNKSKWALPSASLDDGAFVSYWVDGNSSAGVDYSSVALSSEGGVLYLYDSSGTLLDSVVYPALETGVVYQRYSDGEDRFIISDTSTRGSVNVLRENPSVTLYINEILADNEVTLMDPDGSEYADWIEIYNPNEFEVELGGLYLTDDSTLPTQWKIPEGVNVDANSYLVFWCDKDEELGPMHTNFKLSSKGEEIGLYENDLNGNVLVDLVEFDAQDTDVSYGREADGSSEFSFFEIPTPGFGNAGVRILSQLQNYYVGLGYSMALTVEYVGGDAPVLQWFFNDSEIAGAIGDTIVLGAVEEEDAGAYSVRISDGSNQVAAEIAVLQVESRDPEEDTDGDGILNEVESAFGMNPEIKDKHLLPRFVLQDDAFALSYAMSRDDIEYRVETSSDLSTWTIVEPQVDARGLRSYLEPFSTEGAQFFRIRLLHL